MSHIPPRIVVTGAESTGKTTLTRHLAQQLGVEYSPESARHYLDACLSVNPNYELLVEDVLPIAYAGRATELWLESRGMPFLLCDTDVLSTIVYGREIYGFESDELEILLRNRPALLYLLLDIDTAWTADPTPGQRESAESRAIYHELFRRELEVRNLPFRLVSAQGDFSARIDLALKEVRTVLKPLS